MSRLVPPTVRQVRMTDQTIPYLETGTILDGKYEVLSFIGSGGMGSIYKARHVELGNLVAIKIMHGRFAADPESVKRFQNEARFIANLRHKNILSVYSFGTINGLAYIAMEFIEGQSLSDRLDDGGPFSPTQALPIFLQVCDAMSYAHKLDVLHRDLKPANVMMVEQPDGTICAKVVDFGLAKLLDGSDGSDGQRLTHTGEVVGDPNYMSPEQAQGKKLDARSDVYSCGCLMYEVLSGQKPFTGESPVTILYKQISENPQPFASTLKMPPALEAIIFTCMTKDAAQRYESFAALASVLSEFLQNPNLKIAAPTQSRGGKKRLMIATACLAMLSILAALGLTSIELRESGTEDSSVERRPDQKHLSEKEARQELARSERLHDPIQIANSKTELVHALIRAREYERAMPIAEETLRGPGLSDTKKAKLQLLLGATYFHTGKNAQAIAAWEQVQTKAPDKYQREEAAAHLVTFYINCHKWDDAERVLKCLDLSWIAREHQLNNNYVFQIGLLCHHGRFQEAERLKEKILASKIDDLRKTEVLGAFVTAFSDFRDLDRALDCLQEMRGLVRASRHPEVERMGIQTQIAEMTLAYHTHKDGQVIRNGKLVWDRLKSQEVPNREQLQQAGVIYAASLERLGKVTEAKAILNELRTTYRL